MTPELAHSAPPPVLEKVSELSGRCVRNLFVKLCLSCSLVFNALYIFQKMGTVSWAVRPPNWRVEAGCPH